jgi:hypothetical protein
MKHGWEKLFIRVDLCASVAACSRRRVDNLFSTQEVNTFSGRQFLQSEVAV